MCQCAGSLAESPSKSLPCFRVFLTTFLLWRQYSPSLCGAILETANGNLFVKMTGPNAVVKASTDAFKKMVSEAAKTAATNA
jgi:hypothetical protein